MEIQRIHAPIKDYLIAERVFESNVLHETLTIQKSRSDRPKSEKLKKLQFSQYRRYTRVRELSKFLEIY